MRSFPQRSISRLGWVLVFLLAPLAFAETPQDGSPDKAKTGESAAGIQNGQRQKPAAKDEAKTAPKPDAGRKPAPAGDHEVITLTTSPLVQKAKVSGVVESTRETPVEFNLKRWTDLTVVRVVPHGTAVKAGDVLIELETKDLKKKIDELKRAHPAKELELAAAELDLEKAEKATPLSLEKAMREKMQAEQDLVHFEDESRPMQERGAREDVKEVTEALAYAQEELNQLKKMYEKDDLTEETEEIILRRAENSVARYQWMLEQAKARTERTLNVSLPREHENLKRSLEMRQIEWRAGEKAMRDGLEKTRLATEAKRREMEESILSLAEHEQDLAAMRVTAPHDGVVYYGMNQRGKWTTASLVDRKLIPGGKLAMREVAMTVSDPTKPKVRLQLKEDQLKDLAGGQRGTVSLKWKPDFTFPATLETIGYVPFADQTFDAMAKIAVPEGAPALYPGMTVEAEFVVYESKAAILVPKAAVTGEGQGAHVTLPDGKTARVKTGRTEGDKVEILEGLKAGDKIRSPIPKKDPAPAAPAKEGQKENEKQG